MKIQKLSNLLLSFLFTFHSFFVRAQDHRNWFHPKVKKYENYHLKPHRPYRSRRTLLIYGGLKPAINGILKLDDKIWTHVQAYSPNFHTNAADYLIWVPSASIYAMDAFHVKTQHTFKEHLDP